MKLILLLACQAVDLWSLPPEAWPKLGESLHTAPKQDAFEGDRLGVETFVLFSTFDEGISIEDAPGVGTDIEFGWDQEEWVVFGFSVGAAGWVTDNDKGLNDDRVTVVQYRASIWADFRFKRFIEVGVAGTAGYFRYRRDGENDTSPFLETEGSIAVVPIPNLKAGVMVVATNTQSSFNRSHTHLFHHYSVGPFVEFRF